MVHSMDFEEASRKLLKNMYPWHEALELKNFVTNKGHTRDAGPGFYSCRKHFLLINNETRVSGFF